MVNSPSTSMMLFTKWLVTLIILKFFTHSDATTRLSSLSMVVTRCLNKSIPTLVCLVLSGCQIGMSHLKFQLQTSQRLPKWRKIWVRRSKKPCELKMRLFEPKGQLKLTRLQPRLPSLRETSLVLPSAEHFFRCKQEELSHHVRSLTEKTRSTG